MTTETTRKKVLEAKPGQGNRTSGGNGGRDPRFPLGDGKNGMHTVTPQQYKIGMLVAIAAILMMFVGLVSAYIVRAVSPANDWVSLTMPAVLPYSTALLFISSVTFEMARRNLLGGKVQDYSRWLVITAWLGFGFLILQLLAWRSLVNQTPPIYVSSNPHSAFFYVLTALHGLHLLGGVVALGYLVFRALKEKVMDKELKIRRVGMVEAARLYWHFLTVLWVALFVLLFFWKNNAPNLN